MKLILDARALDLYPVGRREGFRGGTEVYVEKLAAGLADKGHVVHVVCPDLDTDEQRGPREFWWGPNAFPTRADAVIMVPSIEMLEPYTAEILIVATNGLGHSLGGPEVGVIDAFPVFSETHADMLNKMQGVDRAKCFVTGLGVDGDEYGLGEKFRQGPMRGTIDQNKVPGRIMVGNDPQRGLWHVLDIFDKLKPLVPHATLHITYDVEKVFEQMRWQASYMSQQLLECERRVHSTEGVVLLGALSRAELVREQLECQVHVWPSDPPNIGSQISGITQFECAAAGAALVLSDIEAFPECFGGVAELLPVPGAFIPAAERRCDPQDWAEVIAGIMHDPDRWAEMSRKSRALAEQTTWAHVIDKWQEMLMTLAARVAVPA